MDWGFESVSSEGVSLFPFVMSIFENWNTFERWCAAVPGDYEVLIHEFLISPKWDYKTFRKLVQKIGTVYLHQWYVYIDA